MSYPNEEVNSTKPSLSVSLPWLNSYHSIAAVLRERGLVMRRERYSKRQRTVGRKKEIKLNCREKEHKDRIE
jgi:hypothetical protein